jgi:DUF1707 SHOCT-like domain/Cell wall-active antibiotics response LiaF, C-terminal
MTPGGTVLPEPLPPAAQERVVAILTRHFANDLMSEAELESRLQRVYAATTDAELVAIVADLPPPPAEDTSAVPAAVPVRIKALFSGQESKLTGELPREITLRARLGYVELDLTRATFAPGVTTIDVHAFMGYVQIRFPPGVRVQSEGHAIFGYFALKGGESAAAGPGAEHVVRVTGRAVFGFAECFAAHARVAGSGPDRDLPPGERGRRLRPGHEPPGET